MPAPTLLFVKRVRRSFTSCVSATVILFSTGLMGLMPSVALAASVVTATNGTFNANFQGAPIPASSPAIAAAKVTVTASQTGQTLQAVTANFSGTGFTTSDLATIATDATSGVALFTDHASSGTVGVFDAGVDPVVTLAASPDWTPSSTTITLAPSIPVSLTSGVAKIFYIVIKTSGTISDGDLVIPAIPANGVVTSDGMGPSGTFIANNFRADTAPAQIQKGEGFAGSATVTVRFNKPVQKVGSGNLVVGDTPFTYVDGGGSVQTIASISHSAGQNFAVLTMSGNLDAGDVDGSPATIAAGTNKIADMGGNIIGTTPVNVTSDLTFTTVVLPTATAGLAYSTVLVAAGGTSPYSFATNAAGDATVLTTVGLALASNGTLSGTPNNLPGSYQVALKVTDAAAVVSMRMFTLNVANASGAVPGITSVSPPGGAQGASGVAVTVTGINTSFTGSSTVEFLLNGSPDSNIVVSSRAAASVMSLGFNVAIAGGAASGNRDVKITTGGEVVTFPNGFTVFSGGGSGLNLSLPTDAATNIQMPPGFSFTPSNNGSVVSYRVSVKGTSDFSGSALWDYVFPTGSSGHCVGSSCNLSYGVGSFRILTQPTSLAPNTTYYWQVKTYSESVDTVSNSATPLENTSIRSFTTVTSVSDVMPPQIMHRPVMQLKTGAGKILVARVTDNIATSTSTPALTSTLKYCNSSASCTPTTDAAGTYVAGGYWKYTIPQVVVDHANSSTYGIRYYLTASDGTNTANFKQPDGTTPFTITIAALATTHKLIGTITDQASACLAGAYVFVEGTAFNTLSGATSCAGGTYSIGSIPPGNYDLTAIKEGYGDRRMQGIFAIPTADSTPAYNFSLNQGASGGFGGDTSAPRVMFNGPMDGMANMPGGDSNFKVFVAFNKPMSQSTITASNLLVEDVTTGTPVDITSSKGAWVYYATAPVVPGLPPAANMAVWALSGVNTLGDGKTIAVVLSNNVTDTSGNAVQGNQPDGSYAFTFSTGTSASFVGFNTSTGGFSGGGTFGSGQYIPPRVLGSTPSQGMFDVPRNTKAVINFSDAMADDADAYLLKDSVKLFTVSGSTETDVTSAAVDTVTLDSGKRAATVALKSSYNTGTFVASTSYRLKVLGSAKSGTGITLAPPNQVANTMYTADFKTGTVSDTGTPALLGSFPDSGATAVPVNMGSVSVGFSKDMNTSTITTSTFYLSVGSTAVNGIVEYKATERQAVFTPSGALSPNTTYTVNLLAGIQGLNSQAITATTRSFTTGAADTLAPNVAFVNADDYNLAVTFSEPMNAAKVTDSLNYSASVLKPANYTLNYGVTGFEGGTAITIPSSASFSFDPSTSTLTIAGYHGEGVTAATLLGKEILVTVSNLKDLSGNAISGTTGRSSIADSATTKGALMPGVQVLDSSTTAGFMSKNFSSDTFGFAPQVEVRPFNAMVGQTTIYGVRLPVGQQVPASGTIVLTFPTGFDVSGAKQDVNSPMRTDLNGPGTGTPTFKCTTATAGTSCGGGATVPGDTSAGGDSATRGGLADDGVIVNTTSRTITVTLSAATNTTNDFLSIDIAGIKNSTVPKDFNTTGYTVDIKTKNSSTALESLVSKAFYIQGVTGTAYAVSGTVTAAGNDQAGTMKVYLMSPMTGPLDTTSVDFNDATSGAIDGATKATYTFTNLSAGDYYISTDPSITLGSKEFAGKSNPERVVVNETADSANAGANDDTIPYDFTLASNTTGGTNVTISIDGPSAEPLDIFASSSTGFKAKQVTLDSSAGAENFTFNLADGMWFVGVGPQMPKGFSGPPKTPSYLPPKSKETNVTNPACIVDGSVGCSMTFTLTSTTKTIRGTVKDTSDKVMANAEVYAYSPNGGFGTHAQTDASGAFSMGVADGSYVVGAFVPGMPSAKEVPVVVTSHATIYLLIDGVTTTITPAAAASSFVLKIAKPDYTISGKVTDGTNVIQGASVFAYRTDAPGHANAITDSSGNYTLYASNGTWKVGAFLPQYGNLTELTVTISGSSATNQNFAPSSTGTFQTVSGTVMSNGSPAQGAFVKIARSGFFNETITGSDGTYSMKVPAAAGYVLRATIPGVGESAPLAPFTVAAETDYSGKDITIGTLRTVTFTFSSSVTEAFVELFSSTGVGNRTKITNATTGTLQVPDGSYTVRVDVPGVVIGLTSIAATTGATTYSSTTGIMTVADGNEGLTVTIPTLRTITGTVVDGSAVAISSAWVELMNATNGIHYGTMAGSDGTFSIKAADGTYQINAMKSGYFRNTSELIIDGATPAQTLAMAAASTTIRGQVLIGASGAANAFVRAERQGGGFSGTKADASGNYILPVTSGIWKVYAVAEGYAEAAYISNPIDVTAGSVTGKNITVSTPVTLSAPSTKPITPDSGGTLDDTTAGIKLTIPAKAFGSSKSAGSLEAKETNNVRETSSAKPLESCEGIVCTAVGKEIKATDSDNNPITDLDLPVTIEMTYTLADLAATESASDGSINTKIEADALKMAYWDETAQSWATEPTTITYKNAAGAIITDATTIDSAGEFASTVATITIATSTDHFSLYAPVVSTDPSAPSAPTGLAKSSATATSVTLTWAEVSGTTGYDIYRSTTSGGTYSLVGSDPTVSSGSTVTYTNTGLAAGTTYYYKISALNASGESAVSSAVSAATNSSGGSSGGGGGGSVYVAPTTTCAITAPAIGSTLTGGTVSTIAWTSNGSNITNVVLSYTTDGGTVWTTIAAGISNSGSYAWMPPETASTSAKVRVECRDASGSVLVTAMSGNFSMKASGSAIPAVPAVPAIPDTSGMPAFQAAPVAILIHDPSQLDALLASVGATRSVSEEAKWSALVHADALAFKVGLTAAQQTTIANFVAYGASAETKSLGAGERRALIRDYLETVGRPDVSWDDIQRLAVGKKPLGRNLPKEQAKVGEVLKIFVKLVGHSPDFKDPKQDIAWNTLMYRIRFSRDLNKERAGITKFLTSYKRTPSSPLDWSAVRAWGYSLK